MDTETAKIRCVLKLVSGPLLTLFEHSRPAPVREGLYIQVKEFVCLKDSRLCLFKATTNPDIVKSKLTATHAPKKEMHQGNKQ